MIKKFYLICLLTLAFIFFSFSYSYCAENTLSPLYDEELVNTIISNLTTNLADKGLDINNYHYFLGVNDITSYKIYCFEKTYTPKLYMYGYGELREARVYSDISLPILWYNSDSSGTLTFKTEKSVSSVIFYDSYKNGKNFFYSTYPIYNDSTYTDFFFQPAQPEIMETQGIVVTQIQNLTLTEVMKEILGVLPMILALVVFLVGLMKGLKEIKNLLTSA